MRAFVGQHREVHGVEPICRVLQIAPSLPRMRAVFGSTCPRLATLFGNKRTKHEKVSLCDGLGIRLEVCRHHQGPFTLPGGGRVALSCTK